MDKAIREKYEVTIGLEVHAQLSTQSKIYSGDSAIYGSPPNTQVGVISLGHPGTLPKLNKKVVELAVKMGLACHSDITKDQIFDRKNYFYPDLSKGYQITQDRTPLCRNGYVQILSNGFRKRVHLVKIHMEEDAGRSIHAETETLLDFNRAGIALIEIVTKPEISSSSDAAAFLSEVRKLVRYLEICDGNMEEGSLRCDANVSVRLRGAAELGKKVEIKNLNSIRNLGRAIDYDVERQIMELEEGKSIFSESRSFQANSNMTFAMRTKEELNDYRYFPDPDLSPLHISDRWLTDISKLMPVLPHELVKRFTTDYQLSEADAYVLTETKEMALYFEEVCRLTKKYKPVANWMIGPVKSFVNEQDTGMAAFPISPDRLVALIDLIDQGAVSFSMASQRLFPAMIQDPGKTPWQHIQDLNLHQDSNTETIQRIVEQVIKEFPLKVEAFKNGKKGIVSMFMGEVMKRTGGKADPKMTSELISKKLLEK